jgi:hypothetical protein
MSEIHIGRLLRANTRGCVAGGQVNQPFPAFGSLVSIPLAEGVKAYGLVTDIHIDDDGLVRQLAASGILPEEVIQDNRLNRNVPVELSVLFVGYSETEKVSHLLPPRPPLSLDRMFTCSEEEIRSFTSAGRFGYLRHILGAQDIPAADLLAAHLMQAGRAQAAKGNTTWARDAIQEVITLLRDDHAVLTAVLGAIADAYPGFAVEG